MKKSSFAKFFFGIITFVFLITVTFPSFILPEENRFSEINEKGLERELQYGDSIKDQGKWKEFSRSVKDKQKAAWEYESEKFMMEKLGLTSAEAESNLMTNTAYLAAKAKWEQDAADLIEKKFGTWKAKQDWDYHLDSGQLRNKIIDWVWSDKGNISNVMDNVLQMKERVLSNWQDCAALYNTGLVNILDALQGNVDSLSQIAKENYLSAIQSTAEAHREALTGIGQNFIYLEEQKYIKYMARISLYQSMTTNSDYNFDESNSSNNMDNEVSNVNSTASNMQDPMTLVKQEIAKIQTNVYDISERLRVGDTPEEDLTVGIKNWEEMVRNQYQAGLQEWEDARLSLLAKMSDWDKRARDGYTNGLADWGLASDELARQRKDWEVQMQQVIASNVAVWSEQMTNGQAELSNSLVQLTEEIDRSSQDYDEYSAGMMQVFVEGSSTLKTIDDNLSWLSVKMATNRIDRAREYASLTYYMNRLAGVSDFTKKTTVSIANPFYSPYSWSYNGYNNYTTNITVNQNEVKLTGIPSGNVEFRSNGIYIYGNFTQSEFSNQNVYVTLGTGGNGYYYYQTNVFVTTAYSKMFLTGGVTTNMYWQPASSYAPGAVYINGSYCIYVTNYTSNGIMLSTTTASGGPSLYQLDSSGILFYGPFDNMSDIANAGKQRDLVNTLDSDYATYLEEQSRWNTMKLNYITLVTNSQNKLQEELFSTSIGKGILSNSTAGNGIDLYLRSEKEMEYAKKIDELNYYQEKKDIAKAVADYALSNQNQSYDQIQESVAGLSNSYMASLQQYSNAKAEFDAASTAVSNASAGLMADSTALAATKAQIDQAMATYEAARKEYEKQQEILAVLEEGGDTIKLQSKTFIEKAINDYISALSLYDKSRDQYYGYYIEKSYEEEAKSYYNMITNFQSKLDGSIAGTASCEVLVNSDLAALSGKVDSNSGELLKAAQADGIDDGLRGRLLSIESLSNSYKTFYQTLRDYLTSGNPAALADYTNYSYPQQMAVRNNYVDWTLHAALAFIGELNIKRNGPDPVDLKSAFSEWENGFDFNIVYNNYPDELKKEVLQGVWNYVSHMNSISDWLSGESLGYEPQAMVANSIADWDLAKGFAGSGGNREALEQYLREHVSDVDSMSRSDYQGYVDMLSGGGEFSGLLNYYDKYISDVWQAADSAKSEFSYMARQMISWGGTFFSMKSGDNLQYSVEGINTVGDLKTQVESLTNQLGKYGGAVDEYINEMLAKLEAANLMQNNGYDSATNNKAIMTGQLNDNMQKIGEITNLLNTQGSALYSCGFVNSLYGMTTNEEYKSGLQNMVVYETIQQIDLNFTYSTQDAAETEIAAQIGQIYGSAEKIAGLTKNEMAQKIKDDVLKRAITTWIGNALQNGETDIAATLLSGYDGRYQNLGKQFEEAMRFTTGEDTTSATAVELTRLLDIQSEYLNGTMDGSIRGDRYYQLLESLDDYRVYRNLSDGDKALVDAGFINKDGSGAIKYLLSGYGNPALKVSFLNYTTVLSGVMQELTGQESVLMNSAQVLANQINGLSSQISYYDSFQRENVLRKDKDLLEEAGQVTSNIVVDNSFAFDTVVSNTLYVRKDSSGQGYTEVYRMYAGFSNVAAQYSGGKSTFTALLDQVTNAVIVGSETAGWKPENLGYEANDLLSKNQQQYQALFANWNDAADKLTLWATAYREAGKSSASYLENADYQNAVNAFGREGTNVTKAQDAYYQKLALYNTALSNYYSKLDIEGQKKTVMKGTEIDERKAYEIYQYAMLPLLIGTEENSWNTANATNFIRPLDDYSNYLNLFNSNQTELNTLGAAIQTERQLVGSISAELNQYKNDYSNYMTLLDATEIVNNKEGAAYKAMVQAQETYERQASLTFGDWNNTKDDPLFAAVVQQFARGELSMSDLHSLLQATIGRKESMDYDKILSLFGGYNNQKWGNLYRMIFGISTKDNITNIAGAEIDDFNAKIAKYIGPDITNTYSQLLYTFRDMKQIDLNSFSTGSNISVMGIIESLEKMQGDLKNVADSDTMTAINNLLDKLSKSAGYYKFDRKTGYGCLYQFWVIETQHYSYSLSFDKASGENTRNAGGLTTLLSEYTRYNNANSWLDMMDNLNGKWNTPTKDNWAWLPQLKVTWHHVVVWAGVIEFDWPDIWLDWNDPIWLWNNLNKAILAPTDHGNDPWTASVQINNMGSGYWDISDGNEESILKRWGIATDFSKSSKSNEKDEYNRELGQMDGNVKTLQSDWADYNVKTNMAAKYSFDVRAYTNDSGKLDAAKFDSTFFDQVSANLNVITSNQKSIAALRNVFDAEKDYIMGLLNGPGVINDQGKISMSKVLEIFQDAMKKYLTANEDKMRADMHTNDQTDAIYLDKVITTLMSPGIYGKEALSSEAFRTVISEVGNLKKEAYKTAKIEEQQIQANRWQNQLNDIAARRDQQIGELTGIFNTGEFYWQRAQDLFAKAMTDWDSNYTQAYNEGMAQWVSKTNILNNRKEEWLNLSVNVVGSGSADFISDEFNDSLYNRTMQLVNDDLPVDVAKSVQAKAKELQQKLAPRNSQQYMGFFTTQIEQARYVDVKFVMDGISRFGYSGGLSQEFNNQMQEFKAEQVKFAMVKMKEDYRDTIKDMIGKMNQNVDDQDYKTKYYQMAPMVADQGFSMEGSSWAKRNVVINSSAFGDKTMDFVFDAYHDYTNRLDLYHYLDEDKVNKIDGHQAVFDMFLLQAQDSAQNDYKALMGDFSKHVGSESYSSGEGAPQAYNSNTDKGELYRLSWATSYYGYLESIGNDRKHKAPWDKPLWDNTDPNDPTKLGFGLSFFDVNRIVASVVMTCTGVGALAAAAINLAIAVTHDVMNLATGHMSKAQFGVSLLTDAITGVAAMATAGLGEAATSAMQAGNALGSMGISVASAGINSAANLATSGLHVNGNGQMDWSLSKDQWNSAALGTVASVATVGINQGLGVGKAVGGWSQNIAGGSQSWLGNAVGYGMQKATESFVSSGLSTLASSYNMSDGSWKPYDWSSVGTATAVGAASGFAAGGFAASLGGTYNAATGSMNFKDNLTSKATGKDVGLFYGGSLNQVANTFGSIAGEAMSYGLGRDFRLNLAQGVGVGFTHDGQVVRDDSGGVGLSDLIQSGMNMNYVGFQAGNAWNVEGQSRISMVNLGYLSGFSVAQGISMDVINGKKRIVFSDQLSESAGAYGSADRQNGNIMLSSSAVMNGNDPGLAAKLAFYSSTMVHEGTHLNQDTSMSASDMERQAYYAGAMTQMALDKKFGLSVKDSQYAEISARGAYFAMTGDAEGSGLDINGESLKRFKANKDGSRLRETTKDDTLEGLAKLYFGDTSKASLDKVKNALGGKFEVGKKFIYGPDNNLYSEGQYSAKTVGDMYIKAMEAYSQSKLSEGRAYMAMGQMIGDLFVNIASGGNNSKAKGQQLVNILDQYFVGTPYVEGGGQRGKDTTGYDCVGAPMWSLMYKMGYEGVGYLKDKNGILYYNGWDVGAMRDNLPSYTISESQLQAGDLIFCNYRRPEKGDSDLYNWDHVVVVGDPITKTDDDGKKYTTFTIYQASQIGILNSKKDLDWLKTWTLSPSYNTILEYRRIDWNSLDKNYKKAPK